MERYGKGIIAGLLFWMCLFQTSLILPLVRITLPITVRIILIKWLYPFLRNLSNQLQRIFGIGLAFEKFPKVKIGSSLQPEHIPATFAGLVEVQLCVDSFMTIHMCSLLWICINFQNVVISLATAHIMCSWLVVSRNCHRHLCSSPSDEQRSPGSANVCSGPDRSKVSQCCSNMSQWQILEFRFLCRATCLPACRSLIAGSPWPRPTSFPEFFYQFKIPN